MSDAAAVADGAGAGQTWARAPATTASSAAGATTAGITAAAETVPEKLFGDRPGPPKGTGPMIVLYA